MHITYQEWKQLEPTIRASQDTDAALAGVASKLLKHPVAESQIWYFRRQVLQLAPPIARWKFSAEDIQRLTDLMQQESHVVLHRGRKRLYMTSFETAMKGRTRFMKDRVWEKGNGAHGLASASASHS